MLHTMQTYLDDCILAASQDLCNKTHTVDNFDDLWLALLPCNSTPPSPIPLRIVDLILLNNLEQMLDRGVVQDVAIVFLSVFHLAQRWLC